MRVGQFDLQAYLAQRAMGYTPEMAQMIVKYGTSPRTLITPKKVKPHTGCPLIAKQAKQALSGERDQVFGTFRPRLPH